MAWLFLFSVRREVTVAQRIPESELFLVLFIWRAKPITRIESREF